MPVNQDVVHVESYGRTVMATILAREMAWNEKRNIGNKPPVSVIVDRGHNRKYTKLKLQRYGVI